MDMTAKLKAFAQATNNELFDPDYKGGEWMIEAVETHETIDQFVDSSNDWSERSASVRGEIAGLPFITWAKIQPMKGAPRRALSVVDFGSVRYALETDLTYFV